MWICIRCGFKNHNDNVDCSRCGYVDNNRIIKVSKELGLKVGFVKVVNNNANDDKRD